MKKTFIALLANYEIFCAGEFRDVVRQVSGIHEFRAARSSKPQEIPGSTIHFEAEQANH